MRISSQEISKNQDDFNSSIKSTNEEQLKATRINEDNISDERLNSWTPTEEKVQYEKDKTQLAEINTSDKQVEVAYEEGTKPKSVIRQFFSSIFTTCSNIWTKFKSTKLGKFLTSTILGHFITILLASLTLAGVLGPVAPLVLPIGIITLVAVAVGVIADTIKTRSFRKLVKENNLLVQNRENLRAQEIIWQLHPSLKEILEKDLYLPGKAPHKPHDISYSYEMVKNMWNTGIIHIANILSISVKVASATTGNIPALVSAIGNGTVTISNIAYSGYTAHQLASLSLQLKKYINLALDTQNIEQYKNLQQLEHRCHIQAAQTFALMALTKEQAYPHLTKEQRQHKFLLYQIVAAKLIEDKDYRKLSEEHKIIKLHEEAGKIRDEDASNFIKENKKNIFQEKQRSNVNQVTGWLKSVGKDVWRVLDPLYEPPEIAPQSLFPERIEVNQQDTLGQEPITESRPIDIDLSNPASVEIAAKPPAPETLQRSTALIPKVTEKSSQSGEIKESKYNYRAFATNAPKTIYAKSPSSRNRHRG